MSGQVPFDQGLYHNNAYEALVKSLKEERVKFAAADLTGRKQVARQLLSNWTAYVDKRAAEVPGELKIAPKVKQNMWSVFNAYKQRNSARVEGTVLLDFLNEYVKVHRLNVAVDPEILLRQVHPFHGSLTRIDSGVTFDDFFAFLETLVVASFEKLQGQTMLATEICAYAHWRMRDRQMEGWLPLDGARTLFRSFDIQFDSWEQFAREFEFCLQSNRELLLWRGESPDPENVLPFDLFRHACLERNL